jgi:hypothetical protein
VLRPFPNLAANLFDSGARPFRAHKRHSHWIPPTAHHYGTKGREVQSVAKNGIRRLLKPPVSSAAVPVILQQTGVSPGNLRVTRYLVVPGLRCVPDLKSCIPTSLRMTDRDERDAPPARNSADHRRTECLRYRQQKSALTWENHRPAPRRL